MACFSHIDYLPVVLEMGREHHVLILEPGIRIYKEPIVQSLAAVPSVSLYFASGLSANLPMDWVRPYSKGNFCFSYTDSSLLTTSEHFCAEKRVAFDGVLTYTEPSIHAANKLQHSLGLPMISTRQSNVLRNKLQMRSLLQSVAIRQPRFIGATAHAGLQARIEELIGFPLVVKPTEMMASLGVTLVKKPEELNAAFLRALKADFWDENLRELYGDVAEEVLIEEYIKGPEYSVETVVQNGKPRIIGITKKYSSNTGRFDEVAHCFPADDLSRKALGKIEDFIEVSHRALELQNTFTHTEVRLATGSPVLMEINCRLGGGLISTLVEKSLGINIGEYLVSIATGKPIVSLSTASTGHEIRFFGSPVEGRVISVPTTIPSFDGFCEYKAHVKPGHILFRNGLTGLSRVGHLIRRINRHESPAKVKMLMNQTKAQFRVKPAVSFQKIPPGPDWISLFQAGLEDVPNLVAIEEACWTKGMGASSKVIAERITTNPHSTLIGYSVSLR
ncbi:MAG: ATP-grasp domain-containing protein [Elusimicrobia bacterium]|nr:ATP-grasp domain-containing protein [Elusimicrobiota bacterium]